MERHHLALLLFCLLEVFGSARAYPPSRDSVTMRANVKLNAEQLVIRLDLYLKVKEATLLHLFLSLKSYGSYRSLYTVSALILVSKTMVVENKDNNNNNDY